MLTSPCSHPVHLAHLYVPLEIIYFWLSKAGHAPSGLNKDPLTLKVGCHVAA